MTFTPIYVAKIFVGLGCAVCSLAQTPAPGSAFEVASIRVSETTGREATAGKPTGVQRQGNRVSFIWMSLKDLVAAAYGVQRTLVVGGKELQSGTRFDILTTLPEGSTGDQYPAMLRTLLAERFGLQAHRETREMLATVMTIGPNGHKLKPVPEGTPKSRKPFITRERTVLEITEDWDPLRGLIAEFVFSSQPFLDQTGLQGRYSGVIEIVRPPEFFAPNENDSLQSVDRGMSIATAERLGFKITERKLALEAVVVDHLNTQPSEN